MELGRFSNDSYSLSSYSFSASGSDTVTSSSSDTFTSSGAGSDSGNEVIDGWTVFSGSGTYTNTGSGGDGSAATQNNSWDLTELGTMSAGILALSCYVFSENQSNSASSNDNDGWSGPLSGNNNGDSFSGTDSGSDSDSQVNSASNSLLEVGTATGNALTLSLVSYSGSGSENGSTSQNEGGNWSGQTYSGNDSDTDQSGDNGSYSVKALGSYSNGSFSLSSYVLQGGSTDTSSSGAGEQDTLLEPGMGTMMGGTMPTQETFTRSDTTSNQQTTSVYQAGVVNAGLYSNLSYNQTDSSIATVTEGTSAPSYSSGDAWQSLQTQSETLSGATATTSATLTFQDTNDTGGGSSVTQSGVSFTVPGLLVNFATPDASSVPRVGAEQSSGGMPLSAPNLGLAGSTGEWLLTTGTAVRQVLLPGSAMPMVPSSGGASPAQSTASSSPPPAASGSSGNWLLDLPPQPFSGPDAVDQLDAQLMRRERMAASGQTPPPLSAGSAKVYGNGNQTAGEAFADALRLSMQMLSTSAGPALGLGFNLVMGVGNAAVGNGDDAMTYLSQAYINGLEMASIVDPCSEAAKALALYDFHQAGSDMMENGVTLEGAVRMGLDAYSFFGSCFTGDMLLRCEGGKKRADAIREGDLLWSRDEHDADGPLVLKRVLRRFERTGKIWHVRLSDGQVLRTTLEHPFWVANRQSWLSVGELRVGDMLRTDAGELLAVEGFEESGKWERVYNWEVEDYHTYFVSATEEAASIWAHNTGPEQKCLGGSSEEERTVSGSMSKGGARPRIVPPQETAAVGEHTWGYEKFPKKSGSRSVYTQIDEATGKAKQNTIYNEKSRPIAQVDFQNHGGDAYSGHGHYFGGGTGDSPILGHHASGAPHVEYPDLPEGWDRLPPGVEPMTPIGY